MDGNSQFGVERLTDNQIRRLAESHGITTFRRDKHDARRKNYFTRETIERKLREAGFGLGTSRTSSEPIIRNPGFVNPNVSLSEQESSSEIPRNPDFVNPNVPLSVQELPSAPTGPLQIPTPRPGPLPVQNEEGDDWELEDELNLPRRAPFNMPMEYGKVLRSGRYAKSPKKGNTKVGKIKIKGRKRVLYKSSRGKLFYRSKSGKVYVKNKKQKNKFGNHYHAINTGSAIYTNPPINHGITPPLTSRPSPVGTPPSSHA